MLRTLLWGLMIVWISAGGSVIGADPPSPFAKWDKAISAFEAQDQKSPPPQGAVLFVGSSSIRLWKVEKSFPNLVTINRGFGGSEIADSVHFADRIVLKYQPKTIVFYAGDNDIAHGKSPVQVAKDFQAFVKIVHKKLPKTKILFIAIKPSLARWKLAETIQKANGLIRSQCEKNEQLEFIDVWKPMLGDDGRPRAELFLKDGLHMNEQGYKIWASLIKPHLSGSK